MALHALCLCDGYGGFELAFRLANLDIRTVARVERDSYAASTLVARMEEAHLDQAPVWDDLTTFDGKPWRGRVDLITAGFPCQPFSAAGNRAGVDDERWLWPDIARIVADVGPTYVLLENVPGLVRAGLPHVLADLANHGFNAEWGLLSAADVGATHLRDRIWILAALAHHHHHGRLRLRRQPQRDSNPRHNVDGPWSTHVDDTMRGRHDTQECQVRPGWHTALVPGHLDVAHTESPGRDGGPWDALVAERQAERTRTTQSTGADVADASGRGFPPRPDDADGWQRWITQGGPQPSVRRGTDGRPTGLADALHLGGNGLVPRVAASALTQLADRLEQRSMTSYPSVTSTLTCSHGVPLDECPDRDAHHERYPSVTDDDRDRERDDR